MDSGHCAQGVSKIFHGGVETLHLSHFIRDGVRFPTLLAIVTQKSGVSPILVPKIKK